MRPIAGFQNVLGLVVAVLLVLWFLYLAYKIAEHVGAWPFA